MKRLFAVGKVFRLLKLHVFVLLLAVFLTACGNDGDSGGSSSSGTGSWVATSTTSAPSARAYHTAVWNATGTQMIVWGGFGSSGYVDTGGKYNPSTDSWTATSTTSAPSARAYHTAVWNETGTEMIVWGGWNGSIGYVNTGGKYNPSTNVWTATSTTSAPSARAYHTAVWNETGTQMIVWGGSGSGFFNTGGRYNPSTDSWTATSTTSAPSARAYHTA
ncbi:MAG: hypothetical protein HZA06_01535, partial [Nitrospirae bacterium]|nr:hypothetical protein [Nitrospirota bacterium]